MEPTEEAQDEWVDVINGFHVGGLSFLETCTPGYYNNEGAPRGGSAFFGAYTPGINAFNQLLEEWREQRRHGRHGDRPPRLTPRRVRATRSRALRGRRPRASRG